MKQRICSRLIGIRIGKLRVNNRFASIHAGFIGRNIHICAIRRVLHNRLNILFCRSIVRNGSTGLHRQHGNRH